LHKATIILRDISLVVEHGERLGVLGPNGSGKSTLLKIIHGGLTPQRGRVLIEGQDIRRLRRLHLARLVAVVPQEYRVLFPFTVKEMVLMGRTAYLRGWPFESQIDREVVAWALESIGMRELAKVPFQHLSSGEKQRVIVARAIAQRPKILLLDEFTASLDVSSQLELHAMVDRLCREQELSAILGSHDLNLAIQHCDRLSLLNQASVVATGKPEEVLLPQHIRRVFGVEALVDVHPVTQRLHVIVEPQTKGNAALR
jgi:iron complex transport system ATP-binding protein